MKRNRWWLAISILVVATGLIASQWSAPTKPVATVPALVAAAALSPQQYVGWQACTECHSKRVEEFQQTRHFLALRFPDQVEFPRGFQPDFSLFQPAHSPVAFEMTATAGTATLTATPVASNSPPVRSPIEFIYGAGGGTDEVYFTRRGDQLFELPVAWLHPQDQWGASLFDPHGTGDLSRPLTPQCLECHTTWVDYHRGTLNEYGPLQRDLVGVTCERCHGPAKSHVEHHRSHPREAKGVDIVAPKSMTREQRLDLCAQCHTNAVRHRKAPFSYRPGEAIEEAFRILKMRYPEEDRVANQVQYLKESRCYQQSESLTCISCHDPHHVASKGQGSRSHDVCSSCHQSADCGAQDRLPTGVRDQCVACHMPLRNKVQVGFTTRDDEVAFPATRYEHRIAVYPEAEQEVLLDWHTRQPNLNEPVINELRQSLAVHWSAVAESAVKEQRFLRAIDAYRRAIQLNPSLELKEKLAAITGLYHRSTTLWFEGIHLKQQRRLNEAILIFESLLQIEPHSAKSHLELGTLLAATGQTALGIEHLRIAAEGDPNDPGPHAMLGWLDYLAKRPESALVHYVRAAEIEPWSRQLESMKGQCYVQLQRWEESIRAFERVLEIDPRHRETCVALRRVFREQLSAEDALPHASRAVEVTHAQRADLLIALAEIYRDLQRIPEAEQVLVAARKAAQAQELDLLPQVKLVEESLRSAPRK
ncbi:MAG: c-type cytochrome precursor [Schlesneria sp.]|nr:c-type cytochrome precursor [Schlesneria sp.]